MPSRPRSSAAWARPPGCGFRGDDPGRQLRSGERSPRGAPTVAPPARIRQNRHRQSRSRTCGKFTHVQLDAVVARVADHKHEWASLSTAKRITLLRSCLDGCVAAAPAMVRAGCEAKGLRFNSSQAAEEWLSGPVPVVRNVRLLNE